MQQVVLALRALIRRFRFVTFTLATYGRYWPPASKWIRYTEYDLPTRPSSGEAVSLDWSLWIGRFGFASVRTWARNDDLEFWIAGRGPYTSAENVIDIHPAFPVEVNEIQTIRIRNNAPNQRTAAGRVCLIETFLIATYAFQLQTGEAKNVQRHSDLHITGEMKVKRLFFQIVPTGPARFMRLHGTPEWWSSTIPPKGKTR